MANTKKEPIIEEELDGIKPMAEELKEEIKKTINTSEKQEVEELKKKLDEQQKKIEMLLEVADKKNLSNYYDRNKDKLPTHIKVRSYNGKIIVGWKSIFDTVERDLSTGRIIEKQEIVVFYKDGNQEQLPMVIFEKNYVPVNCRMVTIMTNADGGRAYKLVRLDNGEEIEIADSFVN